MKLDKVIFYIKRLYRNYIKKYLKKIFISLILSLIVAGTTSATAWLLDPAVKKIFIDQDKTYAFIIPILIVIVFSLKGISLYLARAITLVIGHRICQQIRGEMANNVLLSDTQTLESKHTGKYVSHFLYDVGLIYTLVSSGLLNIMKDTFTLTGLLILMFYQNWKLALFSLIMMPLAAFVAKSLGKRMGKATTESADASGNFATLLSEILRGAKIIKIYQREDSEKKRVAESSKNLTDKEIKIGKIIIRATPIMEILTGIMIAGFIYFSGFLIAKGEIGVNNFFSFLAAMMLSYQPVRSLATLNMSVYQAAAAAERIFALLDRENKIKNNLGLPSIKIKNSNINFENINFQYDIGSDDAVKNINLNIQGNKVTALVGHSGAGKSTILNLIPRFYEPQNGKILIDNQNISEISLSSLRKNISLVSQDVILFDDTVENNVRYARLNSTQTEIIEACSLAAADEFIKNLPEKYNTIIGENGLRLSGGQKQRISIARAILKNSPIILLDEATSSLDADSESKVQNAIFNLTKNKTTLVIAHRFSTIKKADNIVLMSKGNVIATGTHNELLNNSKEYENLYKKQILN
jgi:subfamily B ATP-binding cassette protein MsbA